MPSARLSIRKNPGFGQDKRGVPYLAGIEFADLNEYSTILSQFEAGAFHDTYNNFLPDDILATKQENPIPRNPDLRRRDGEHARPVRSEPPTQSSSISACVGDDDDIRHDIFIEVSYNTKKFEDAGLADSRR